MINRNTLLGAVCILALMVGVFNAYAKETRSQKPNIIFILTDDQGYGDLGRHKNPVLKTPHMDRLFDQSVRFDDFTVSPTCSPSRCAMMTGKHEFKSGVTHTITGRNRMSLESTTIAELLKRAGYATGIFGKWHLGHEGDYRPEKRGFDKSLTTIGDTQRSHFDPVLLNNGKEQAYKGFRTDILFREATSFIQTNKDKPFFCYIPTYSPHNPLKAPPEYIERYKGKGSQYEVPFFAMLSNIDDNIGKLMAKLKTWGLDKNTLIIFMNDNGGTQGVDLFNASMRGCKATPWFGGTRAMSFWRWPAVLKPKTVDKLAAHVDLLPTLAELAGVKIDKAHKKKLDGVSLVPLLTTSDAALPDRMLFTHMGRWPADQAQRHKYALCAVRWQHYQLVRSETCDAPKCRGECRVFQRAKTGQDRVSYSKQKGQFHYASTTQGQWALYDTRKDPAQHKNLAKENPKIVKKMAAGYEKWWNEVSPKLK